MTKRILGIIPARYASSRFPAKALADIAGQSMIQRVYHQAKLSANLQEVIVATDHSAIYDHVVSFGGKAVMTANTHQSGTDRCFEAYQNYNQNFEYVINIQGDEPFIQPQQIDLLVEVLNGRIEIATLIKVIESQEVLFNVNTPKVLVNSSFEAQYFSRQTIPFLRDFPENQWLNHHTFYKHIGIYAYRTNVLSEITKLKPSVWEKAESLEQLRWLEHGFRIQTVVTPYDSLGIDTPQDLTNALLMINL